MIAKQEKLTEEQPRVTLDVKFVSEYRDPETGERRVTFRTTYQPLDGPLTREQVNKIQEQQLAAAESIGCSKIKPKVKEFEALENNPPKEKK